MSLTIITMYVYEITRSLGLTLCLAKGFIIISSTLKTIFEKYNIMGYFKGIFIIKLSGEFENHGNTILESSSHLVLTGTARLHYNYSNSYCMFMIVVVVQNNKTVRKFGFYENFILLL